MATSTPRSRRLTSVIARMRPGQSSGFGAYSVAMGITAALEQYQDILSVGFSTPNYVIGLNSPDIQLEVLRSRLIETEDGILDVVPWCPEYEEFKLPWIITTTDEVTKPQQAMRYMQNLIGNGKALQQLIFNKVVDQQNRQPNSDDEIAEHKIYIPDLATIQPGSSVPDFSYLMILELKKFYAAKLTAFRKCAQSCQELCHYTYEFSKKLDPIFRCLNDDTNSITSVLPDNMQTIVVSFSGDVQSQALYISEEIDGIDNNICHIYKTMDSIIDLHKFKKTFFNSPNNVPSGYTSRLKFILKNVVHKLDKTTATVSSETTNAGNIITRISVGGSFQSYQSSPITSVDEAESDAIYRFLQYKTNVDGYSIVDLNYPILANMVSQINKCNREVTELLICATKAVEIIEQTHNNVSQLYKQLCRQVPQRKIKQVKILIQDLLNTVDQHCLTADYGLGIFQADKQVYESIQLETKFRSAPSRLRTPYFAN